MNQPSQISKQASKQTSKRIVSKGEYVKLEGKRAGLVISSGMLILLGAVCVILTMLAAICVVISVIASFFAQFFAAYFFVGVLAILLFGSCAYVCAKASDASTEQAEEMEAVVPFTRANTADLPASESLVRASEKPVQKQQSVLLRAATQTQERHAEQLVRAAAGETE